MKVFRPKKGSFEIWMKSTANLAGNGREAEVGVAEDISQFSLNGQSRSGLRLLFTVVSFS